jgi:hypothetical protein
MIHEQLHFMNNELAKLPHEPFFAPQRTSEHFQVMDRPSARKTNGLPLSLIASFCPVR